MLKVSEPAFRAWDKGLKKRGKRREEIGKKVQKKFYEHKQIVGCTKIAQELQAEGISVSKGYVSEIMKERHLKSKVVKKYKATTNSNHKLPVAKNLLLRERTAEERVDAKTGRTKDKYERTFKFSELNKVWSSDITYIWTDEGWLYLAGMMDLCGKELVGWATSERMTKDLVKTCLTNARKNRNNPKNVVAHSDRGSQYCSKEYQNELKNHGFICSMSRKGNCYDNAPIESFWGKLKQEHLNDKHFKTRDEARSAIFWYIEIYYHRKRLHASNGYKTPFEYTQLLLNKAT